MLSVRVALLYSFPQCFFSIDLPSYSSYATLRHKLLYAITNCSAIDVDFNPNNTDANTLNAWVD